MRLSRSTRAVGGDDCRVGVDGPRRLRRKLRGGPMRVAVPHAPCDRGVRPCQLLEDLDPRHRSQIEPAIGRRQEDAEKPGTSKVLREVFRQPASGFDYVALSDDAGPEPAGDFEQRNTSFRIGHRCLR